MKNLRKAMWFLPLMTLVLMPFTPVKAEGEYDLYVGGVQVTDENKDDILGDGKARYNPETETLTLDNPTFSEGLESAIYANNLDLNIEGNVTATGKKYGIYVENGFLTINSGTINAKGEIAVSCTKLQINGGTTTAINVPQEESNGVGVFAQDGILLYDGELTVIAAAKSGKDCYGVFAKNEFISAGGTLTIEATTTGSPLTHAYGLYSSSVKVSGGTVTVKAINKDYDAMAIAGDFNMSGGAVTADAEATYAYGVYNDVFSAESFTLTGGTLNITSKSEKDGSGIHTENTVTVTGGELNVQCEGKNCSAVNGEDDITISGGTVTLNANGERASAINVWTFGGGNNTIAIQGGELTAVASGTGSFGIYTNNRATIDAGTVNAKGDSYGIYSQGRLTVNNGTTKVTADGGEKAVYTDTAIVLGDALAIQEPQNGKLSDDKKTIVNSGGTVSTHAVIVNNYKYTITVNESTGGTVSADRTRANDGETIHLTVDPEEDCELSMLTVKDTEGNDVPLDENNSFIMPASDVAVTAEFIRYYTVDISEESARFVGADQEKAAAGDTVSLTLYTVDKYVIDGIRVTDAEETVIEVGEDNTFIMPASSVTVIADVTKLCTITLDLNGGTLNGETGIITSEYREGQVIVLQRPERKGYTFDYWEGSRYKAGAEYIVEEDHTFKAVWKTDSKPDPVPDNKNNPGSGQPIRIYRIPDTGDHLYRTGFAVFTGIIAIEAVLYAAVSRRNRK